MAEKCKITFENEDGSKKVVIDVTEDNEGGMDLHIEFHPAQPKEGEMGLHGNLAMHFVTSLNGEVTNVEGE